MKNPLENITIIFVSGKARKDMEYHKTGDTVTGWFSCAYGKELTAYGYWNYTRPIARAGGGGYNKTGVLLADVVNQIFGTDYRNNGEGESYTIRQMQNDGFTVKHMYEVNQ